MDLYKLSTRIDAPLRALIALLMLMLVFSIAAGAQPTSDQTAAANDSKPQRMRLSRPFSGSAASTTSKPDTPIVDAAQEAALQKARPDISKTGLSSRFQPLTSNPFELPNFRIVNDTLLRGGQPTEKGLQMLKDAGVKTIINLRTETTLIENEKRNAKKVGLNYHSIPMWNFDTAKQSDIEKFLSIVQPAENQPVFVHCRQGEDRTGTMVGAYRIAVDRWSFSNAFQEMMTCGFRPGFMGLTQGLHDFAKKHGDRSPLPSASFVVNDIKDRVMKLRF